MRWGTWSEAPHAGARAPADRAVDVAIAPNVFPFMLAMSSAEYVVYAHVANFSPQT